MSQPSKEMTAIVVGYINYGDSDSIVKLLSSELGLIVALAKGSRASVKRFAGAIDLGNQIRALLRPGQGNLWKLQEATVESSRFRVRNRLHKIAMMTYACEICSRLAQPENPDPKLYHLLQTCLEHLEEFDDGFGIRYRIALESKALAFAGLMPSFRRCIACNQNIEDGVFFPVEGGIFHQQCLPPRSPEFKIPLGYPVSQSWLEIAELALRTPLRESIGSTMPQGPNWVICQIVEDQLHQQMKSKPFLQSLENT